MKRFFVPFILFCLVSGPLLLPRTALWAQGEQKVESLLKAMTLEEKVGQMTLFTSDWATTGPTMNNQYLDFVRQGKCGAVFNIYSVDFTRKIQKIAVEESRLKIPLIFGYDVIHGHRTIFPNPLGESCSWDLALMEKSARIAAKEASAEGLHWTFAPMVDITRDPRWGRVAEGAGEDVWLGCKIAQARVRGFQGQDLAAPDTILACAKHFAAYGAPQAGRDYHTVDLSDRTLEETYLPTYKACVDAGVKTFMTAFNEIAGVPATANKELLTNILRQRWGFNGFVVTDYTSINELIPHGVAGNLQEAAELAANAGVDMDMQGSAYLDHLASLVRAGRVPQARIDEAVRHILTLKQELGLFADPFRYCDSEREKRVVLCPQHLEAAREAARKSMVLLKNEASTLPFDLRRIRRLAVIGPLAEAKVDLMGNWRGAGEEKYVQSILAAIREKAAPFSDVVFAKGCEVLGESKAGFRHAIDLAKSADAVVLVLGEKEDMSGEAASRADIDLPGVQNDLAESIARLGKPTAAVLINGRPLTITRLDRAVPAILEAWFPGTMGGKAVADLVFGDFSPSGKLTMTFPRSVGQIPIHYDMKNTGRPLSPNKYTSKYLDVSNAPLYPFGHGLTYTSFALDRLRLSSRTLSPDETLQIEITVKNTGSRFGEETLQCYFRDPVAQVTRPVKQLRGFQKVPLRPGESRSVKFSLTPADLQYLKPDQTYGSDPGSFTVFVGPNSEQTLQESFEVR